MRTILPRLVGYLHSSKQTIIESRQLFLVFHPFLAALHQLAFHRTIKETSSFALDKHTRSRYGSILARLRRFSLSTAASASSAGKSLRKETNSMESPLVPRLNSPAPPTPYVTRRFSQLTRLLFTTEEQLPTSGTLSLSFLLLHGGVRVQILNDV